MLLHAVSLNDRIIIAFMRATPRTSDFITSSVFAYDSVYDLSALLVPE